MERARFIWVSIVGSLILFAPQTSNAGWSRTYGGVSFDAGRCVEQTDDGGYIAVGYKSSEDSEHFDDDLWLLKTDSTGETLWTRTYGWEKDDKAYFIEQTKDGRWILTGQTQDTGGIDFWLLKIDSNGDTLWTKTYGGEYVDNAYCVKETKDGGFIIVGETNSPDGGDMDILLIKTDSIGDTLWTRKYGGGGHDWGEHVCQTEDEGYIIVGGTYSFGASWNDLWLVKVDEEGDTQWTRRYGGRWMDWGQYIDETSDGGYIMTGIITVDSTGANDLKTGVWLLKTNSLGDTLWTRIYGEDMYGWGHYVQETTDSGFIITGRYGATGSGLWQNVWLLKTDMEGDTLWTRIYGGTKDDEGYCVQQTSDGGYIIVGYTESFGAGWSDLWLIKTDSNGDTLALVEGPIAEDPVNWEVETSVGPQIVLRYADRPEGFHAEIFDASGRKVDELHASEESGTIAWGKGDGCYGRYGCYGSGVYFIVPNTEKSQAAKVVLVR